MLGIGDDLVLARVSIDSTGVVRGVDTQERALRRGEDSIRGWTRATTGMSGVALASWTIVGTAVAGVAASVIRAQENYGKFDKAIGQTSTSVSRLFGEVTGLNAALGDTAVILDAISRAADKERNSPTGWLWRSFYGTTEPAIVMNILKATAELIQMQDSKYGTGGHPGGTPGNTRPWETIGVLDVPARKGAKYEPPPAGSPYAPMATRVDESSNIKDFTWAEELSAKVQALTGDVFDLRDAFVAMPEALREFRDDAELSTQALEVTEERIYFAQAAAEAFGQALTEVATGGIRSMRGFLGSMIQTVGQAIIAWGALALAEGIATYDPGQATKGLAMMALGAATIAVGRAIQGSAQGAGGSSQATASNMALATTPAGGGSPTVHVHVAGSLLGTTQEQLARDVVMLWRKGSRDGA